MVVSRRPTADSDVWRYRARMDVAELERIEGDTISRVRRLRYEFPLGEPGQDGDLELTFEGGTCLLFHSVGERLVLLAEPWEDPFKGPLSPENEEFIRHSGKWTAYDVGNENEYVGLVGSVVRRAYESVPGSSVDIRTDQMTIRVAAEGDETCVWREIGDVGTVGTSPS